MNLPDQALNDIVIIGGGITGLSAAYIAAKAGKKVTIIEASETFGGLLNTFEIGNTRLEYYYHHFFTHDLELNWLIKDLNLEDKLIYTKSSMGVYRNGIIFPFNTLIDLFKFKPIKLTDKLKFGLSSIYLSYIAKWDRFENVSCLDWFKKWSGASTTSSLWEPMLNVKFGTYAAKVPLSWMIGRLRQRIHSRKEGIEKLGYIEGSLQVLLDALMKSLESMDVKLINNQPVKKINIQDGRVTSVQTSISDYFGNQFLFTIPGMNIGELLKKDCPSLSSSLNNVKYFGAICLILELHKPLSNIYWLNIADKGFPFGGVIEHTNLIDSERYGGSHIAYLSRYFSKEEDIAGMNDEMVKELMIGNLSRIYPEFHTDWIKNIYIFRTNTAATVCDLNFSKKIPNCKSPVTNLFIANMSHVYPDERSTNNSIRVAIEACKTMGITNKNVLKTNSLSGKIGF